MVTQKDYKDPVTVDVEVVNNGIIEGRSTVKLQRGDRLLDEIQTANIAPNEIDTVQVFADDLQKADVGDTIEYSVVTENASTVVSVDVIDIPDGRVSQYRFEQNVSDSWGGNDGTDNTSAGYTTDSAEGEYAKSFDGSDDLVTIGKNPINAGQEFTFAGYANDPSSFCILSDVEDNNGVSLYESGIQLRDSGTIQNTSISGSFSGWTHFAATFNGTDVVLYVNGKENNSSTGVSWSGSSSNLNVGALVNFNLFYSSAIDDVRIYDQALSSQQIQNLFETGIASE